MIKRHFPLILAVLVYLAILAYWLIPSYKSPLWSEIFTFWFFFPLFGIFIGVYIGKGTSKLRWLLLPVVFLAINLFFVITGMAGDKCLYDAADMIIYIATGIPCLVAVFLTHEIVDLQILKFRN